MGVLDGTGLSAVWAKIKATFGASVNVTTTATTASVNLMNAAATPAALGSAATIPAATTSAAGVMTADDRTKLNGIAAGANAYTHPSYTARTKGLYKVGVDATGHVNDVTTVAKADITALGIPAQDTVYTHPTSAGNKHVPAGGSSGQILRWSAAGTAVWGVDNDTTYNPATSSAAGLMSAADKVKVDGLPASFFSGYWGDLAGNPLAEIDDDINLYALQSGTYLVVSSGITGSLSSSQTAALYKGDVIVAQHESTTNTYIGIYSAISGFALYLCEYGGDGASTTITSADINQNLKFNGASTASKNLSLWAPTANGADDQILMAQGHTRVPVWADQSDIAAGTAATLATPRTIALSGGATGTATSFDGSANIAIPVTALDPSKLSSAVPVGKGGTGATTITGIVKGNGTSAMSAAAASDVVSLLGTTAVNRATADAAGSTISSTYAKLASPTFTGSPKAPTAAAGTNTTQIATTAFVKAAVDSAVAGANAYQGVANQSAIEASAYQAGWYWAVQTAGTYVGETCEVGDMIFCNTTKSGSYSAAHFDVLQSNLTYLTTAEINAILV